MIDLTSDLEKLATFPSDERTRALERIIPRKAVREVLCQTGHDRRHYKILPAWFVVWFVIGLGLFANDSHVQVYKHLQRFRRGRTPRRSALGEARNGLGVAPMRASEGYGVPRLRVLVLRTSQGGNTVTAINTAWTRSCDSTGQTVFSRCAASIRRIRLLNKWTV